ncbi:MAG: serine O-acetyltransferase [Duodenibacillus sp.]|nr:serine O-acetyltransferase [Duodenibacillus sp.]
MFDTLREDLGVILEKDPAAHNALEVILCYPGFHAIRIHRFAHFCNLQGWETLSRLVSHVGRFLTGVEIHPAARIGRRVFIDHGMGVVIGETAEVGDDCTIYHGVTLGGVKLSRGAKRHPTLGRGVVVGAGAQILGGFKVGDGATIGSNAVVVRPVEPGATVVGVPGRSPREKAEHEAFVAYGVVPGAADPYATDLEAVKGELARQRALVESLAAELAACKARLASKGK